MSVTTRNFQYPALKWREKGDPGNLVMTNNDNNEPDSVSSNVDDGLTSLSWLQNLNMCMTRLGAPTPPTPPASPVCPPQLFALNPNQQQNQAGNRRATNSAQAGTALLGGKGAIHSSSVTESANGCDPSAARTAAASQHRNQTLPTGSVVGAQSQPKAAQSTANHKSPEAPKKRASSSQGKQSSKSSRKATPQASPNQPPPCQELVDYKADGSVKPPYSYATLICMAMKANTNKMTLSSIYKWIKENFLYYRNADPSWQVGLFERAALPVAIHPVAVIRSTAITHQNQEHCTSICSGGFIRPIDTELSVSFAATAVERHGWQTHKRPVTNGDSPMVTHRYDLPRRSTSGRLCGNQLANGCGQRGRTTAPVGESRVRFH